MRLCSIEECGGKHEAQGFCAKHYQRFKKYDDPFFRLIIRGDDDARIESYIDRDTYAPCWYWTGAPGYENYAQTLVAGHLTYVHVAAWERENGPVPPGMTIDHECHNAAAERGECLGGPSCLHRRCVNPAHLAPKPIGENTRASVNTYQGRNARKTHCVNGCEFTEANTFWFQSRTGTWCRGCRNCHARRQSATRERQRAKA